MIQGDTEGGDWRLGMEGSESWELGVKCIPDLRLTENMTRKKKTKKLSD